MPVTRSFPARISIADLLPIADSLGAHVAAKLEHFATDERTLTDELCDMFYIWTQSKRRPRRPLASALARFVMHVVMSKTTQQEEAAVGADLAITIGSPEGFKRALIQAKVFDPVSLKLRCDSADGWDKLWSQLVLMQKRNGDLSFLLVYVPAGQLDGSDHGYGTWEQGFQVSNSTNTSSVYGVTLIPVSDLIDRRGNWRHYPPVSHSGSGLFTPGGISFRELLLDMFACRRGVWADSASDYATKETSNPDAYPVRYRAYREIGISFNDAPEETRREVIAVLRQGIDEDFG